jgi:hypothetical protein
MLALRKHEVWRVLSDCCKLLCCVLFRMQADKLDPREQAKQETREWVNDVVDRLTVRIEQFEYEMEEMQANLKKKAKPPPKLVQVRVSAETCRHCSVLSAEHGQPSVMRPYNQSVANCAPPKLLAFCYHIGILHLRVTRGVYESWACSTLCVWVVG